MSRKDHFPISLASKYLEQLTLRRLLLVSAVLHLLAAILGSVVGHFQLLPQLFNEHGIALSDSLIYRELASGMADSLLIGDLKGWLQIESPLHVYPYSLTFVFPGAIVGRNILAAEALNLVYYLGILSLVYFLGRELFDSKSALLAAAIVAVWPSFLLHSIQLLRDPLSIVIALGLILVLSIALKRELSWRQGLVLGLAGSALVVLFWLARGNMWNIILSALAITLLLFVVRMVRQRKVIPGNCVLLLMVLAIAFVVPPLVNSTSYGPKPPAPLIGIRSTSETRSLWERLFRQIKARRSGFHVYTAKESDLDSDVQFNSYGDVLKFLPRAAAIGFLSPFPNMWFDEGSSGRKARILAGFETLAMYALYLAAIVCLWRQRRNLGVWLLLLVAATGMITLGLVVVNVGALYRLRYVFWILMIIIAAEGLFTLKHTRLRE